MTVGFPPELPNSGVLRFERRSKSPVLAERTGPISVTLRLWNMAANRVIFPSTNSSKTTSAWLMPHCGRAC